MISQEYQSACDKAVFFDFSARSKIELSGPDSADFLHNLCTNEIRKLAAGGGCEVFLTTAKARVVAHLFVSRLNGEKEDTTFLLDSAPDTGAAVLKHLDHFLISERVELADRTDDFALLFVCGPRTAEALAKLLNDSLADMPNLSHREYELDGTPLRVRRNDYLALPGFEMFIAVGAAEFVRQRLGALGIAPAGCETFSTLRVEAGFPLFGVDIDENRLAMETGRIEQAISYSKGCYLGQETIVMARDRGHANRMLMGLAAKEELKIPAGGGVFRDGEEVGITTSSVFSPRMNGTIALAYLRRGNQAPGTAVEMETDVGRKPATVTQLPFVELTSEK